MKWIIRPLKEGDHIRVKRPTYFHHGLYVGNNEVIHYTSLQDDGVSSPDEVEVRKTSLSFFAKEEIVEVASLSLKEKFFKRSKKETVRLATSSLGEKNYSFIHNNCEDFANRCAYKKKLTSQTEKLKETL